MRITNAVAAAADAILHDAARAKQKLSNSTSRKPALQIGRPANQPTDECSEKQPGRNNDHRPDIGRRQNVATVCSIKCIHTERGPSLQQLDGPSERAYSRRHQKGKKNLEHNSIKCILDCCWEFCALLPRAWFNGEKNTICSPPYGSIVEGSWIQFSLGSSRFFMFFFLQWNHWKPLRGNNFHECHYAHNGTSSLFQEINSFGETHA